VKASKRRRRIEEITGGWRAVRNDLSLFILFNIYLLLGSSHGGLMCVLESNEKYTEFG
jgi:hypothetical protein